MGETEDIDTAPPSAETKKSSTTTPATTAVENDEPKETEKLLDNTDKNPEIITKKQESPTKNNADTKPKLTNGEEAIVDIPTVMTEGGREVKPKKIPIGGIKMPGFFTKNKLKSEADDADGELLQQNAGNEAKVDTINEKEKSSSESNRRPFLSRFTLFKRKREPLQNECDDVTKNGDAAKSEADENGGAVTSQPPQPPTQKKGLLNAIRLPITNIIPKRLKPIHNDDVELGNGPNNKAGLASMETLDDSLKDTENGTVGGGKDVPDHAAQIPNDGLETVKLNQSKEQLESAETTAAEEKSKLSETVTEKQTIIERLRGYQCSVDDMAIVGGVVLFLLLVGIICAFTFTGSSHISSSPLRDGRFITAVTSCGMVEGMVEDSAYAFRGIPYAVSPIGENRWKPARLYDDIDECWNGTFVAHNSTPVCWQITANGSMDGIEDCLTLDVVTPHVRYDNPLPVVVLIGAESLTGDAPSKMRPSARFSRARDVIYVRPNFRMGVFGFLALDALSKSVHPPTSGNYALSDILAVLEWIKLNIQHFGGNPKSVTLFGHRAGATLVTAIVTSPKAKDLFARAWVSSGSAIFPGKPLHESEQANYEYLGKTECKDAECLRKTKDEDLLNAVPDTWRRVWPDLPTRNENATIRHEWLVLDGEILQKHAADSWNRNVDSPKMVIGTTAHESHSEKLLLKHIEWTPELVRQHIEESKIGELGLTDKVLTMYNSTYQGLVSMISDIRTVCPLLAIARLQSSTPFYVVTQPAGELNIADVDVDVQAILGRYEGKTPEQRRYMSQMQQLFYHYVSHGEMKQYDPRRRVLDIGQDALSFETYRNCDFWIQQDIVPRFARID